MVMECNLSSQNPIGPKHVCKTNNQLPAMSIRGIILGFDRSDFGYHYQKQRHKSLVTVQFCAVYMEMYRDSVIVLLRKAKLQAASNCCLYKFSPNHSPIKTNWPRWSKWWTIKIFWAISNHPLSIWNLKIALIDLEIFEKRFNTPW